MRQRATAHRLGLGEFTEDGAFYALVDGQNVGEAGRCFWPTYGEALSAAHRFLAVKLDVERGSAQA